ncbi:sensor histidine kinase [Halomicrococcus gelatinilyticus]|uniref:sensor histidine kinase n=1 Tax=Halomicrococcus gelatinilyticus TaxID=1702103 RepID=UPI002E115A76
MTEDNSAIPIESHPDPVLEYAVEDGQPVVAATNDVFEATFENRQEGDPVVDVFDRFGTVEPTGDADPETTIVNGDAGGIYLDGVGTGSTYLARVVPTDAGTGFLVFTDLSGCDEVTEPPGSGHVASVISHDLRNPLDVAKAHLRAAEETGDPEHFAAVATAHDRMAQIVRDVLTLTRGEEVVDPTEAVSVESAAEDAWCSVDTAGATLDVPDALPTTTADPDRVRRLFENLFRNAVEHGSTDDRPNPDSAGEGVAASHTPAVTVTVGALEDGFYVADDGPGIPPDERESVFDPGYTLDGGGTGLGLAIVEQVVAAHDWDLTLTSGRDGGARFEVEF